MADGVELTGVSVDGGRLEVPGASSRDPSDDEGPSSSRASPRGSPRPSPRVTPRGSPRASPGISPSGSSGDLAGDGSSGAYRQRKITPASGGVERYKPRSSPTPGAPGRKMSKMELEALRDRKRNGHLKELERLLNEALPGTGSVFTPDGFVTAITSPDATANFFGLFDWDGAGYFDQDEWIEFLKGRQQTNQQRELVEVIETAAYLICGYQDVTLERFSSILQARGVAPKFYRILQEKMNNHISVRGIMEFIANLSNARPQTGFTKENLEWLEQLFRTHLKNSQELNKDDFTKIVHSKNPFFAERVFQIFDRDNSGTVSLQEFLDSMHQFAGQSHDDKIRFLFKVYDLDGDGLIQHNELQHVIHACMEENGMRFSEEQIEDLTAALFEDADAEEQGAITYEALKAQLEKHDGLLENLSISIDRWLVPPQPKKSTSFLKKLSDMVPYQFSLPYIRNNYVYLGFLFVFLVVNVGMFVGRIFQFLDFPVPYILARACGYVLDFCCAFIVAVMLRNLITLARTNGLASILPLDEHIYFHKMAGWFIFVYSVVHTIAHFINFAVNVVPEDGPLHVLNSGNWTYAEWLLTTKPGQFGLVKGFANPSGIALMVILTVMVICSQPFVRKKGNFEVFYWTHLLYVPFYILLILHAPNFWHWFIAPGVLYLVERLIRLVRTKTGVGRTYISSGILLPSKVTHLVIKRPHSLDYHPGDYLFVNIPAIAKYEWHPFTISSAPEQDETLWLHIRALGGWTHRLYDYFEEEQLKIQCLEEGKDPDEVLNGGQSSIQKMKKSIRRLAPSGDKSRRISFNTKPPEVHTEGVVNEGCEEVGMQSIEEEKEVAVPSADTNRLAPPGVRFNNKKQQLAKTRSLPDMDHRMKKREKLLMLRGEMRSNSETKFDEAALAKARNQAQTLPYKSPQNKSLAKSFRYMRRKPTIIAFKTPSSDDLIIDEANKTPKDPESREVKMEEGRFDAVAMTEGDAVKYPVGKPLEIHIDGPYGTPSSHIFRAQHAVLIGTGIGVTPFASILQSIMYRYWKNRHKCPRCEHEFTSELPEGIMNLKKVDFFWINRDQRSFEWFVNLLSQLEIEQAEQGGVMDRFLDMHMYITSALQKTDMKAVGLQLALDLLHEKEKRDLITGLKTRTIAGRPNWNKVFRQIQEQKKGKVTVFFCGPPALSRTLRYKCDEFGFKFRKENF